MYARIHTYLHTYIQHTYTYIHTCIGTLHTSPTYRHTCIYILYTHTCRDRHEHPTYNTFMLLSYLSNTRSHSLVVYSLSLYLSAFLSLSRSRSFYLYIHTYRYDTHVFVHIRVNMPACICVTCIHAYMHTCIHGTYTYTHA